MKIIFDLDNTLINTALLKEDIFDFFRNSGAPDEKIQKTYKKYISEVCGDYNFSSHAEILEKECQNFNKEAALQKFFKLDTETFKKYVDKETVETLDEMKKVNVKLFLLTKGSEVFQTKKIRFSGLEKFFDKIVICQTEKVLTIKKMQLDNGDFFVNDCRKETRMIMSQHPGLRYFLMIKYCTGKSQTDPEIGIPTISSVKELLGKIGRSAHA